MSASASGPLPRLDGIDAARGFAMLLVFFSHFTFELFERTAETTATASAIWLVTLIASPTFMLVSGMMLGLLFVRHGDRFSSLAHRLRLRGLFLLTVGHVVIMIACIPRSGTVVKALEEGFITDVIGVGLLVGPLLMMRLRLSERLALGAALLLAGLALNLTWFPTQPALSVLRYILAGPTDVRALYDFPLLPWLGLYLLGAALGEWAARSAHGGTTRPMERRLAGVGALALMSGAAIKAAFMVARAAGALATGNTPWYQATTPLQKMPPSLPYMLVFGGIGLLVTASMLALSRRSIGTWVTARLATLGRASLFVFLLQFYVYYVVFYYVRPPHPYLRPVFFAASVVAIFLAARWWLGRGLNSIFNWRLPPDGLGASRRPAP